MMSVDGLSPRAGGRQLPATSRARGRAGNRGLARGEGTGGTLWLRGSATPSSEQLRASEGPDRVETADVAGRRIGSGTGEEGELALGERTLRHAPLAA